MSEAADSTTDTPREGEPGGLRMLLQYPPEGGAGCVLLGDALRIE